MILLADSEGPDQTARMCSLICAFNVRIRPKTTFCMAWPKTKREMKTVLVIKHRKANLSGI